jgi:hypothetical protein
MGTPRLGNTRMTLSASNGKNKGLNIRAAGRVNTIGLSDRDLSELLQRLDATESKEANARRVFSRWAFRQPSVTIRLQHPGGSEVELRLACRNLSQGGVSLLHSGYVHPGTQCSVTLPRLAGGAVDIAGEITRCLHRRGMLHELGVRFNNPINIHLFIDATRNTDFHVLEHVKPQTVFGRLLLVEDCPLNTKIVKHYLRETKLQITAVATAADGINAAADGFDIILTDWSLPDMSGVKMLTQIREGGITTPAIIITADPVGAIKEGLAELPNVAVLAKPITQEQVLRAVAERVMDRKAASPTETTKSGGTMSLSSDLLSSMREQAEVLNKAARNKDVKAALPICFMLIGAAAPMGHPQLGGMASTLVDAASANQPIARQLAVLNELARHMTSAFGARG